MIRQLAPAQESPLPQNGDEKRQPEQKFLALTRKRDAQRNLGSQERWTKLVDLSLGRPHHWREYVEVLLAHTL